jgi:hypothetical protein
MSAITTEKSTAVIEVERLGFTWTEVAQYDLEKLDPTRRVQVREMNHYAPKDEVERYAIMMAHSEFPPIIVTSDDWIVDGNTRAGASLKRGNKFFPAIMLDVGYLKGTQKQKDELHALAATLNSQHGRALDRKEARIVAAKLIGLNWKAEQIARAIGIQKNIVGAVKREIDAEAKLTKVGLDGNGSLKGASLRALGQTTVLVLNDAPYREVAQLAADAGLNQSEIQALAKSAKDQGSDTDALAVIAATRAEFSERIREHELTGAGKPPVARQLRQALGRITKFEGTSPATLIETNPVAIQAHTEALAQSIAILTAVLAAQEKHES